MTKYVSGGMMTVCFAASYLVFAGSLDLAECCFALVVGCLATGFASSVERIAHRHLAFSIPWRAWSGPLAALLPETLQVAAVIVASAWRASPSGSLVRQPFAYGDGDDRSAGRRAIALIGSSLAPRSFVIRSNQRDLVIMHSLPPKAPTEDQQWLA